MYQDRFVKELRLANISDIESANTFLTETYLPKINAKFAVAPSDSADGHAPLLGGDLREMFVFEHTRVAGNDYVVRFECRHFQFLMNSKTKPGPKDKALIRIRLDGTLNIYWQDKALLIKELESENQEGCLSVVA